MATSPTSPPPTAVRPIRERCGRRRWAHALALLGLLLTAAMAWRYLLPNTRHPKPAASPLTLEDLHRRAFSLASGDRPERAIPLYDEILARSPADRLALKRLAAVHMTGKRWKPVLALAERLETIPGAEVDGQTLAAIAHHELRHAEEAVAAGLKVLQLDPDLRAMPLPRGLFWNNLALDLMALGRHDEAAAHLARELEVSEDANLKELLGLAWFQQGDMERAGSCWRQAVQDDPRNAHALLGLGRLALIRKRPQEALSWLERAAEASPSTLEPVYNLARAHRLLGHAAEADRLEQRAAGLRASRPTIGGMGEMPDAKDFPEPVQ